MKKILFTSDNIKTGITKPHFSYVHKYVDNVEDLQLVFKLYVL